MQTSSAYQFFPVAPSVEGLIIMPCATQNNVDSEQAKKIVANNIKYYIEVANMQLPMKLSDS